jgi:predicted house-cleaning NTP pyrophosphatase (Maf/HAM1 superfamily)
MLLQRLGIEFTCEAPDIDESPLPGETAIAMAQRLAEERHSELPGTIPRRL